MPATKNNLKTRMKNANETEAITKINSKSFNNNYKSHKNWIAKN